MQELCSCRFKNKTQENKNNKKQNKRNKQYTPIRLPDKRFKCLSSRSPVELFLFVMQCFCVRSAFGGLFTQKVIVQGQCSLK